MRFTAEELELFAGGTEVFMAIVNEVGLIKKANDRWNGKFQVERLEGKSILSFVQTTDRAEFESTIKQLKHKEQVNHQLIRFIDSELQSFTLQLDLTYQSGLIYLVGFDVTDHYKEHLSLVEMSSMAKVGAWYHDPIRNKNYWSDECYRIHDLEIGAPTSAERALDYYLPQYRKQIDVLIDRLYNEGASYEFSGEILTEKGKRKWIWTKATPTIHDGKLIYIYGITADQTRLRRNMELLKKDKETRELALRGIKAGLFDFDIQSDTMFINPDFRELLGLSMEDDRMENKELIKLIHPDDRQGALNRIKENLKEEGNYHFNRYRLRMKDGNYRYYEVYGWRKKNEDGHTVRMVGNLIDVHDRVLIQQERTRILNSLEAMVNNGFIYSMLLDKQGVILMADQNTIEIIKNDYSVDPLTEAVRYIDVMPDIFKPSFSEEFTQALQGKTVRKEVQRPLLDGSMQWLDVMYRPIKNDEGDIVFVLTNLMNVSERKKAELATKASEAQALELSELKSKTLSDLSHEIRTPLNGIMGINELLAKSCLDPDEKKLLEAQKESSIKLLKALTDMIAISDQSIIEKGMNRVRAEANEIVGICYRMYVHMANMKGLEFELYPTAENLFLIVDRELFITAVGAIINNALKYTHKGSVKVEMTYNDKLGQLAIAIKDTGIGIDSKEFGKIFQHYTADQVGLYKKFESSGISLGIAKQYIESMNGNLKVLSTLEEGSEFIIIMPAEYENLNS